MRQFNNKIILKLKYIFQVKKYVFMGFLDENSQETASLLYEIPLDMLLLFSCQIKTTKGIEWDRTSQNHNGLALQDNDDDDDQYSPRRNR